MALIPLYTASDGTVIGVVKGGKSAYDFKVKYRQPGKRERTPKHIHIIIDLCMKLVGNEELTLKLVRHIINNIIRRIEPANSFPTALQIFRRSQAKKYADLNNFGEYPVDFLLVITELIQIQEKTNYPQGTMNLTLFQTFLCRADIFSVVSKATFPGHRR